MDDMSTNPTSKLEYTREYADPGSEEIFVMPTSVAQQRFWILDQLEPGNTSLNMPLALSLKGDLDTASLKRALNEIVSRHEVLRTTFTSNNGNPVQVIAAKRLLDLEIVDLSGHPERNAEVDRQMVDEAHIAFDLERGPLFKSKLIRLAADDHILLLTLHHIICDGWSNGVLVREIGEIYDAFVKGQPSPHDELPVQYADFTVWQQDWLRGDGFEDQLAYWKQQLGNELPTLNIPTDFPRNKNRASFGAIESLLLPQALTRALKTLGQRRDVTPFMIFLAAFNVLLHRYSGQEEILIGSPTANRIQSETEGLIGAFANTLLLRSDLSGDPSFNELLYRVKDVSLGAFSNQTIPFEKVVETIRPATNARKGGQLFQVLFIFQTAFMQPVELDCLSIKPIRSVSPGSIFELSLGVVERLEGTRLQLEYNTDLFKAETIRFMLEDLQSILQAGVLDTNGKISELLRSTTPIRSRDEKENEAVAETFLPSKIMADPNLDESERIEATLTEIWQDVLHVQPIGPNDDFFDLGGHSLLAARLFDEVSKRLKVNLPLATLFTATTIRQVAELIRKVRPKDVWTSLVPINPEGTKPPLFLMHAAGGNVLFYKDLAARLGDDQPCYGMQAVGLSGHQSAYDRIEDMAAHYIKEIRGVQPKGPYYVGGSSLGGVIAYEAGMQLRKLGEEVKLIALIDTWAPGYPKLVPGTSRISVKFFAFTDRILHHIDTLRILEPGRRWTYVEAKAAKAKNQIRRKYRQTKRKIANGVLKSLGRPLPDALVATQNAIQAATSAYRPVPYQGDVVLFRASKRSRVLCHDDTLGWSNFVKGRLDIHEVNGSHGSIVVEPRVRFVAATLTGLLDNSENIGARSANNGID